MMCCVGPVWALIGYYLGRWCLFAWKPTDYPASPRWMCNPANDVHRRWLLGLLILLMVLWWVPLIWVIILTTSSEPWLMWTCLDLGLVGFGLVKWLEFPRVPRLSPPPRWFPASGRWVWGLVAALGLLGLVWQYGMRQR